MRAHREGRIASILVVTWAWPYLGLAVGGDDGGAELDEILNLPDRVAVMSDGWVVAMLSTAELAQPESAGQEASRKRMGLLMAGSPDG